MQNDLINTFGEMNSRSCPCPHKERELFIDNLLVRIHLIIEMTFSIPVLRHGVMNSLFSLTSIFLVTKHDALEALHRNKCRFNG